MLIGTLTMSRRSMLGVTALLISGLIGITGSNSYAESNQAGELVLVAGATGGTGSQIVNELQAEGYRVRAFVRNMDSAKEELGDNVDYAQGDVRQRETIDAALNGVTVIISAIGATRDDPENSPEFVDYGGVRNLAEAAADANLRQIVIVSSSGVTDEDHMLNKMFKNVLLWKFKGEDAVRASGVPYTIVRPGGLVNKPGGETAIRLEQGDTGTGLIPRADVARICVAALGFPDAQNRTFEAFSGEGAQSKDWSGLFAELKADKN